jgi:hypothetical protein
MWTACMLTEDPIDDGVDLWHVERNLSMMCSRFHLYSCYIYYASRHSLYIQIMGNIIYESNKVTSNL